MNKLIFLLFILLLPITFAGTITYQAEVPADDIWLYHINNSVSTSLNGDLSSSATTITVYDSTNFSSSGYLHIEDEVIKYTGKTATTFTGCTRSSEGTGSSSHTDNTLLRQGIYSEDKASSSSFDYFVDNAGIGDAIFFSATIEGEDNFATSGIKLYIGTSITADLIDIEWQYEDENRDIWIPLSNVTDGSSNFTASGEVWINWTPNSSILYYWNSETINNDFGFHIKAVIKNVSAITEGGAQSTQLVNLTDHQITVKGFNDTSPANWSEIYDADITNGWGVVEKLGTSFFKISANLYLDDSFRDDSKSVQIGDPTYSYFFYIDDGSNMTLGKISDTGVKHSGGVIVWYTPGAYSGGTYRSYWGETNWWGVTFFKPSGSAGHPQVRGGIIDWENCNFFLSTRLSFVSTPLGSSIKRTNFIGTNPADSSTYVGIAGIVDLDDVHIKNYYIGVYLGYDPYPGGFLSNTILETIGYDVYLKSGTAIFKDVTYNDSKLGGTAGYMNFHDFRSFNLEILDTDNNPISNAAITLKNKDNELVVFEDSNETIQEDITGGEGGTETAGIDVSNASTFSVGDLIRIDAEIINITATDTVNDLIDIERAMRNTYNNRHFSGTNIYFFRDNLTTNTNGEIEQQWFLRRTYNKSTQWFDQNPHTIKITHPDYVEKEFKFNITSKTDWVIPLEDDYPWEINGTIILSQGAVVVKKCSYFLIPFFSLSFLLKLFSGKYKLVRKKKKT